MLVKDPARKLARLEKIDKIVPIPKADRLEIAVIGGWDCVVRKGLYSVGDVVLYIEIDAAIDVNNPILKGYDKSYNVERKDLLTGMVFINIKTLKLRGVVSQGLVLNKDVLRGTLVIPEAAAVGVDLSEKLNILKYVSSKEEHLYSSQVTNEERETRSLFWKIRNWLVKGVVSDGLIPFPSKQKKSDEERVQNRHNQFQELVDNNTPVEITVKLDGESATLYVDLDTGKPGIAQRNYGLRTEDVDYTFLQSFRVYLADWMRYVARRSAGAEINTPMWKKKYSAASVPLVNYYLLNNLGDKILELNKKLVPAKYSAPISVQGEMVGSGFNGDAEQLGTPKLFIYKAYINGTKPLPPADARAIAEELGIAYVPVISVDKPLPKDIKDLIKMADGPGTFSKGCLREGIVVKDETGNNSFKVISNKWLQKEDQPKTNDLTQALNAEAKK